MCHFSTLFVIPLLMKVIEYIIHSRAKIPRRRQDICKDNVITVINEIVFTSPLDELIGFSNCS